MLRIGTPHPPVPDMPAFRSVGNGLFSWFGSPVNGRVGRTVGGVPGGAPAGGGTVTVTGTFGFTTPTCAQAEVAAKSVRATAIDMRFISASRLPSPLGFQLGQSPSVHARCRVFNILSPRQTGKESAH